MKQIFLGLIALVSLFGFAANSQATELVVGTGFDFPGALTNATELCQSKKMAVSRVIKMAHASNYYRAQVICAENSEIKKLVVGLAYQYRSVGGISLDDLAGAVQNIKDQCTKWARESGVTLKDTTVETYDTNGSSLWVAGGCK
ncbi:MAG: hypothetical protein HYW49_07915 [Deltaproteobacteria bacterium]|nr:hypothetical protein [Deltaproteobacteria bacterium]